MIAIETLAAAIRTSTDIKGIKLDLEEWKTVQYADDLTAFLTDLQCNELNRGHPTFFCQSQDELRTKESEFVHFGPNASEVKYDWELMRKVM